MIPNGSLRKVLCLQPPSRKPIIKMVINYVESSKMIFFTHLPTTVKKKLATKTTPMESFYGQVTRLASASAKASWLKLASVGGGAVENHLHCCTIGKVICELPGMLTNRCETPGNPCWHEWWNTGWMWLAFLLDGPMNESQMNKIYV